MNRLVTEQRIEKLGETELAVPLCLNKSSDDDDGGGDDEMVQQQQQWRKSLVKMMAMDCHELNVGLEYGYYCYYYYLSFHD